MQASALIRAATALVAAMPLFVSAQSRTPASVTRSGTLVVAGHPDEAPLVRINGRSYVDIEALARLTGASVRYSGSRVILTLPASSSAQASATQTSGKTPQFSGAFLTAEIEALTAIREWRVSLVNAVENSYPIDDSWIAPLRRSADSRVQLAAAAATTGPDQKTLELLRNEFANMQQQSDNLLALRSRLSYIRADTFNNNPQDQKILACERALAQVAAAKEFQDDPSCH